MAEATKENFARALELLVTEYEDGVDYEDIEAVLQQASQDVRERHIDPIGDEQAR